ncbi:hypothetical protein [Akkermansia muciniphila]|uniref:hypothetical protein n=1 Tax=Akkermansia muciniphila TaxID=239935 RepID=UPI0011AFAE4D|nr:hypothetical protein [Akkermansia muciniphila]
MEITVIVTEPISGSLRNTVPVIFFNHQLYGIPDILRPVLSLNTDFPSILAGQNENKWKDLKTHGHEWLFPWQA